MTEMTVTVTAEARVIRADNTTTTTTTDEEIEQ